MVNRNAIGENLDNGREKKDRRLNLPNSDFLLRPQTAVASSTYVNNRVATRDQGNKTRNQGNQNSNRIATEFMNQNMSDTNKMIISDWTNHISTIPANRDSTFSNLNLTNAINENISAGKINIEEDRNGFVNFVTIAGSYFDNISSSNLYASNRTYSIENQNQIKEIILGQEVKKAAIRGLYELKNQAKKMLNDKDNNFSFVVIYFDNEQIKLKGLNTKEDLKKIRQENLIVVLKNNDNNYGVDINQNNNYLYRNQNNRKRTDIKDEFYKEILVEISNDIDKYLIDFLTSNSSTIWTEPKNYERRVHELYGELKTILDRNLYNGTIEISVAIFQDKETGNLTKEYFLNSKVDLNILFQGKLSPGFRNFRISTNKNGIKEQIENHARNQGLELIGRVNRRVEEEQYGQTRRHYHKDSFIEETIVGLNNSNVKKLLSILANEYYADSKQLMRTINTRENTTETIKILNEVNEDFNKYLEIFNSDLQKTNEDITLQKMIQLSVFDGIFQTDKLRVVLQRIFGQEFIDQFRRNSYDFKFQENKSLMITNYSNATRQASSIYIGKCKNSNSFAAFDPATGIYGFSKTKQGAIEDLFSYREYDYLNIKYLENNNLISFENRDRNTYFKDTYFEPTRAVVGKISMYSNMSLRYGGLFFTVNPKVKAAMKVTSAIAATSLIYSSLSNWNELADRMIRNQDLQSVRAGELHYATFLSTMGLAMALRPVPGVKANKVKRSLMLAADFYDIPTSAYRFHKDPNLKTAEDLMFALHYSFVGDTVNRVVANARSHTLHNRIEQEFSRNQRALDIYRQNTNGRISYENIETANRFLRINEIANRNPNNRELMDNFLKIEEQRINLETSLKRTINGDQKKELQKQIKEIYLQINNLLNSPRLDEGNLNNILNRINNLNEKVTQNINEQNQKLELFLKELLKDNSVSLDTINREFNFDKTTIGLIKEYITYLEQKNQNSNNYEREILDLETKLSKKIGPFVLNDIKNSMENINNERKIMKVNEYALLMIRRDFILDENELKQIDNKINELKKEIDPKIIEQMQERITQEKLNNYFDMKLLVQANRQEYDLQELREIINSIERQNPDFNNKFNEFENKLNEYISLQLRQEKTQEDVQRINQIENEIGKLKQIFEKFDFSNENRIIKEYVEIIEKIEGLKQQTSMDNQREIISLEVQKIILENKCPILQQTINFFNQNKETFDKQTLMENYKRLNQTKIGNFFYEQYLIFKKLIMNERGSIGSKITEDNREKIDESRQRTNDSDKIEREDDGQRMDQSRQRTDEDNRIEREDDGQRMDQSRQRTDEKLIDFDIFKNELKNIQGNKENESDKENKIIQDFLKKIEKLPSEKKEKIENALFILYNDYLSEKILQGKIDKNNNENIIEFLKEKVIGVYKQQIIREIESDKNIDKKISELERENKKITKKINKKTTKEELKNELAQRKNEIEEQIKELQQRKQAIENENNSEVKKIIRNETEAMRKTVDIILNFVENRENEILKNQLINSINKNDNLNEREKEIYTKILDEAGANYFAYLKNFDPINLTSMLGNKRSNLSNVVGSGSLVAGTGTLLLMDPLTLPKVVTALGLSICAYTGTARHERYVKENLERMFNTNLNIIRLESIGNKDELNMLNIREKLNGQDNRYLNEVLNLFENSNSPKAHYFKLFLLNDKNIKENIDKIINNEKYSNNEKIENLIKIYQEHYQDFIKKWDANKDFDFTKDQIKLLKELSLKEHDNIYKKSTLRSVTIKTATFAALVGLFWASNTANLRSPYTGSRTGNIREFIVNPDQAINDINRTYQERFGEIQNQNEQVKNGIKIRGGFPRRNLGRVEVSNNHTSSTFSFTIPESIYNNITSEISINNANSSNNRETRLNNEAHARSGNIIRQEQTANKINIDGKSHYVFNFNDPQSRDNFLKALRDNPNTPKNVENAIRRLEASPVMITAQARDPTQTDEPFRPINDLPWARTLTTIFYFKFALKFAKDLEKYIDERKKGSGKNLTSFMKVTQFFYENKDNKIKLFESDLDSTKLNKLIKNFTEKIENDPTLKELNEKLEKSDYDPNLIREIENRENQILKDLIYETGSKNGLFITHDKFILEIENRLNNYEKIEGNELSLIFLEAKNKLNQEDFNKFLEDFSKKFKTKGDSTFLNKNIQRMLLTNGFDLNKINIQENTLLENPRELLRQILNGSEFDLINDFLNKNKEQKIENLEQRFVLFYLENRKKLLDGKNLDQEKLNIIMNKVKGLDLELDDQIINRHEENILELIKTQKSHKKIIRELKDVLTYTFDSKKYEELITRLNGNENFKTYLNGLEPKARNQINELIGRDNIEILKLTERLNDDFINFKKMMGLENVVDFFRNQAYEKKVNDLINILNLEVNGEKIFDKITKITDTQNLTDLSKQLMQNKALRLEQIKIILGQTEIKNENIESLKEIINETKLNLITHSKISYLDLDSFVDRLLESNRENKDLLELRELIDLRNSLINRAKTMENQGLEQRLQEQNQKIMEKLKEIKNSDIKDSDSKEIDKLIEQFRIENQEKQKNLKEIEKILELIKNENITELNNIFNNRNEVLDILLESVIRNSLMDVKDKNFYEKFIDSEFIQFLEKTFDHQEFRHSEQKYMALKEIDPKIAEEYKKYMQDLTIFDKKIPRNVLSFITGFMASDALLPKAAADGTGYGVLSMGFISSVIISSVLINYGAVKAKDSYLKLNSTQTKRNSKANVLFEIDFITNIDLNKYGKYLNKNSIINSARMVEDIRNELLLKETKSDSNKEMKIGEIKEILKKQIKESDDSLTDEEINDRIEKIIKQTTKEATKKVRSIFIDNPESFISTIPQRIGIREGHYDYIETKNQTERGIAHEILKNQIYFSQVNYGGNDAVSKMANIPFVSKTTDFLLFKTPIIGRVFGQAIKNNMLTGIDYLRSVRKEISLKKEFVERNQIRKYGQNDIINMENIRESEIFKNSKDYSKEEIKKEIKDKFINREIVKILERKGVDLDKIIESEIDKLIEKRSENKEGINEFEEMKNIIENLSHDITHRLNDEVSLDKILEIAKNKMQMQNLTQEEMIKQLSDLFDKVFLEVKNNPEIKRIQQQIQEKRKEIKKEKNLEKIEDKQKELNELKKELTFKNNEIVNEIYKKISDINTSKIFDEIKINEEELTKEQAKEIIKGNIKINGDFSDMIDLEVEKLFYRKKINEGIDGNDLKINQREIDEVLDNIINEINYLNLKNYIEKGQELISFNRELEEINEITDLISNSMVG